MLIFPNLSEKAATVANLWQTGGNGSGDGNGNCKSTTKPWKIEGKLVEYRWKIYGKTKGNLWKTCGKSMVNLWQTCGKTNGTPVENFRKKHANVLENLW